MIKPGINKLLLASALLPGIVLAEPIPPIDCLIEPNTTIELSSEVSGVLDTILVDRSDSVKEGQILATLKSDVEQVKVTTGKENLRLSTIEQKRAAELYKDHVITLSEKEEADHQMKLFELELKQAEANLEQRIIRSPIDAVIADRYLMPGEFIEDNPILKLAQLNPLRIEVVSPVQYFGRVKPGMHAQIITEFGSFNNLVGEVVVVDKVIDAASGTFGIRLELPNEDNQVPGGLKCKVRFFTAAEEAEYATLNPQGASDETETTTADATVQETASVDTEPMNCNSIGPFKKKEQLNSLMAELGDVIHGYEVREIVNAKVSYLVTTEPFENEEAARAQEAEMKQAGAKDIAVMHRSSGVSIALGLFSNENSAMNRQSKMKELGYDSKVVPQNIRKKRYWADVTSNESADSLVELVTATNTKDTSKLKYQACEQDMLASEDQ